jgi:hypothetical protein
VKSITVNGTDITDLPLDVEPRDIDDLVITYTDAPAAAVSARVRALPGEDLYGTAVLLFPADSTYWTEPAAARRRFRTLPLSNTGTGSAAGLPAGDYFVVFAAEQEARDWQEPSRIELLSRRAQRVTLIGGESQAIEVRR